MSKTNTTAKRQSPNGPGAQPFGAVDFGPLAEAGGRQLGAATRSGEVIAKGLMAINQEVLDFISMRFKEDLETATSFWSCRSPDDAFRVHAGYYQNAMKEYAEEFTKLTQMTFALTQESVKPIEEVATDTLQEIAGK